MRLFLEIFYNIPGLVKYLIYALFIFIFLIYSFLNLSPVFGASPNARSKSAIEDSENFVNGRFQNIESDYDNSSSFSNSSENGSTIMSFLSPPEGKNPLTAIPTLKFQGDSLTAGKFVWLGHSTLLMLSLIHI